MTFPNSIYISPEQALRLEDAQMEAYHERIAAQNATAADYTDAEKAIAEALHWFLKEHGQIGPERPSDFYAAGRDFAAAAEGHLQLAAYDEAAEALMQLRERRRGPYMADVVSGIEQARALVAEKADALRADLNESGAE